MMMMMILYRSEVSLIENMV